MNSVDAVVVRLRGLPTKTSKEDVLAFLEGFTLTAEQVHLQFKERRSAGEAYVFFNSIEEARKVCAKDKDIFSPKHSNRYVRVSIEEGVTPDDLLSTGGATGSKAGRSRRGSQALDTVVKVSGLPPGIKPHEVLQLFWGWQARLGGTYVRPAESGAGTEAFLDFGSQEQAAAAVAQRNGTMITTAAGMFQLSVQSAARPDWDAVLAEQQGSDGIARLKALPVKATADDVLQFLQGYRIKPGGVHVQPFSENRHSKTALVEFEGAEEAVRAMEKDRQKFGAAYGERYCLMQLVSRAEFEEELLRFQRQQGAAASGGASSRSGGTGDITATPSVAAATSFASPPHGSSGNGGAGMLPSAAAAAAGFMTHGLPPMPGGMMLPPGYVLPNGMAPVPGGWPMPPPGMAAGAHVHPFMPPPLPGVAGMPGLAWNGMTMPWSGNTAAARYMVQDLTTGQRVFLDPRFNLSGYGGMAPACMTSSVAATAGTGAATLGAEQTRSQVTLSANNNGPKTVAGSALPTPRANGSNGHSAAAASAAALHTNGSSSGLNNNGTCNGNGSSGQSGQTGAVGAAMKPSLSHCHHHHHNHHGQLIHHRDGHRHAHQASPDKGGGSGDERRTNNGSGGGSNEGSDTGSGADDAAGKEGSSGEGSGADGGPEGVRGASAGGGRRTANHFSRLQGGVATAESEEAGMKQDFPSKMPEPTQAIPPKDPSRLRSQVPDAALLEENVLLPPAKRACVE